MALAQPKPAPGGTPVRSVPPGKFVAELTLGAWTLLLDRGGYAGSEPQRIRSSYDNTLWRTCLHRAFPGHRGPRHSVLLSCKRLGQTQPGSPLRAPHMGAA
jgi:hypothetical protein